MVQYIMRDLISVDDCMIHIDNVKKGIKLMFSPNFPISLLIGFDTIRGE